jgi:hypothetical protein
MMDVCEYLIQLHDQVDETEFNALSPIRVTAIHASDRDQSSTVGTRLLISTDQSGLIGLLRCLHGMGIVFLAIDRQETGRSRSNRTQEE